MSFRALRFLLVLPVVLLAGCAGFFPPINGGGSGSGTNIVYVANAGTTSITAFAMSSGALASVSGSPYSLTFTPTAIAVNPANTYLYVGGNGVVYAYAIGTGGVLTAANSGAVVANGNVVSMDISPDGKWLFALDGDGTTVREYSIDGSTGLLTAQTGAAYSYSSTVTVVPKMIKVSPGGSYVMVALGTAGEIVYTLNTTTGVIAESQRLSAPTTTSDNAIAMDKNTAFLFIARSGNAGGLAVFTIGTAGALNIVGGSPFTTGTQANSVVVDNTAKYVYVGNRGDGTISAFSIGTTGALTAISGSPYSSGTTVTALAADSTGKYILAAASGGAPDLGMYAFDTSVLGRIYTVSSTTSAYGPVAVAVTH
ncbi:lactonase family protein [Terriglobus tenax]|uniref:lactonase family protein n=1 Tax=Terriglobus tenax TaxID=1111115 RepID=UPI0021E0D0B2|nr:lactonase family protein [Terriglobus tenax]